MLRKVSFLEPASEESLAALVRRGRWTGFTRGEFLYHFGEPATRLYVIADGRVAATLSSPQGTPVMFHVATTGEAPGQINVLAGGTYSASAQALTTVGAFAMPSEACRALLQAEPACLLHFATELAQIVDLLTASVADLVFLDLERRLARFLLEAPSVGDRIHLSLTQSELAARLGVARQSLNRALAKLVERGFVASDSARVIRVLDRPAINAFVDSSVR